MTRKKSITFRRGIPVGEGDFVIKSMVNMVTIPVRVKGKKEPEVRGVGDVVHEYQVLTYLKDFESVDVRIVEK